MVTFSAESYIFGLHTNVAGFKQISLTSWFIRQRLQLTEVSKLTEFFWALHMTSCEALDHLQHFL